MYRNKLKFLSAIALVLYTGLLSTVSNAQFNPREYPKRVATCKAIKRGPDAEEPIDLSLRYVNINPGTPSTILMVHGWPGLWSTWSNQIQELKDDYNLVIPDLRGFGESTHPGTRSSGTMGDLVGDLVCILEHARVSSAICMGHDWGSQLCYEAARMRPDIFTAVIGAVVPYVPAAGPFVPVKQLVPVLPRLMYQLYFDTKMDEAVSELNRDIRRSIRATFRTVESPPPDDFLKSPDLFLDAWRDTRQISPVPFFNSNEENYLIEQYSIQGFAHTLQFYLYENRHASWHFAHEQGNHTIPQQTLAIYPLSDPVADWQLASRLLKSNEFLPNLTTEVLEGSHWVHLENPKKFNGIVRDWLKKLMAAQAKAEPTNEPHIVDEL